MPPHRTAMPRVRLLSQATTSARTTRMGGGDSSSPTSRATRRRRGMRWAIAGSPCLLLMAGPILPVVGALPAAVVPAGLQGHPPAATECRRSQPRPARSSRLAGRDVTVGGPESVRRSRQRYDPLGPHALMDLLDHSVGDFAG